MYVRPISALLLAGRSTPAIRAIIPPHGARLWRPAPRYYPCRCLCFGLVQITLTTPLRWMILQLSHIFLTDALTFIFHSWFPLARALYQENPMRKKRLF